ncbi:MAG: Rmt family 16S rRNA (guanine(1405)-N(7))-methyltransferase [bacterium]|nr:Rmt family 16S rRNA (guanine(1405)-N(7))-methyltransferase [bacterium]
MIEEIIERVKLSSKYKDINEKTILEIINIELPKHKNKKSLVKAVKNKLHQIYGAFLNRRDIEKIKSLLLELKRGEKLKKEIISEILQLHQSTRERIGVYEEIYREIFKVTGKPSSIIDLACGLNPFSIPFMNIESPILYYAYDIDSILIETINEFLSILDYQRLAKRKDVLFEDIEDQADICFIFKFLPIAEQIKKGLSLKLLSRVNSEFIIVSFPLKSISGRGKGMLENYSKIFEPILEERHKILERLILENEMFYILIERR